MLRLPQGFLVSLEPRLILGREHIARARAIADARIVDQRRNRSAVAQGARRAEQPQSRHDDNAVAWLQMLEGPVGDFAHAHGYRRSLPEDRGDAGEADRALAVAV